MTLVEVAICGVGVGSLLVFKKLKSLSIVDEELSMNWTSAKGAVLLSI